MLFHQRLEGALADLHLLKHPFYQSWTHGALTSEQLRRYACQYRFHVDAFPRYISATHSLCDSAAGRQFLLENLIEEEHGAENHPELWRRFAEATGVSRERVESDEAGRTARAVVDTFMASARRSYHEGLASLYAYEYQIPEIADVKIEGLVKHYGITTEAGLQFFNVHREADRVHRARARVLLDELATEQQQEEAIEAAVHSGRALWKFLTEMEAA